MTEVQAWALIVGFFSIFAAYTVLMLWLIQARFGWLNDKFTAEIRAVDSKLSARVDGLEARIDDRFKALESRMDDRFNAVTDRLDRLEKSVNLLVEHLIKGQAS